MTGVKPGSGAALHAPHRAYTLPMPLCAKEGKRGLLLILAASLYGLLYGAVFPEGLLFGFINGLLTGVCIATLEVFWVRRQRGQGLRRQSMLMHISLLTGIWSVIILVNLTLTRHWLGMDHELSLAWIMNREVVSQFLFSLVMVFLFNFVMRVSTFLGGSSLVALVLGRYQDPVDEKLAFMILDISGSTQLTERLGDVNTQRLIARFFFDISELIGRFGGEIHRYIGDQMVVTWRYDRQPDFRHLLYCLDSIYRLQDQKRAFYESNYGAALHFRVGLHGGHVLVSEVGDQKRELAYFGDTINVAAGMQQQCKAHNVEVLISTSLLQLLMLPPLFEARSIGAIQFKGKRYPVAAHALIKSEPSVVSVQKPLQPQTTQSQPEPPLLDAARM